MHLIQKGHLVLLAALAAVITVVLSLLITLTAHGSHVDEYARESPLRTGRFAAAAPLIFGAYAGTVAITAPVQLATLDIAFDITQSGSTLLGVLDLSRTLVYSGAKGLSGSITGQLNGITPTFQLASDEIGDVVSGRRVTRRFTMSGQVLQGGDTLAGNYSEVITGFTPQALTVQGLFMVIRPSALQLSRWVFLPLTRRT